MTIHTPFDAYLVLVAAGLALSMSTSFSAAVVNVPAISDLYLAGQPAGTACCYIDNAPTESPILVNLLPTPGGYLTFSATSGATNQPRPLYPTPDGNTGSFYNLHADYGTYFSCSSGLNRPKLH